MTHPLRRVRTAAALLLVGGALLGTGMRATRGESGPTDLGERALLATDTEWLVGPTSATGSDMLTNGGLNGDYYWSSPNHYTAPDWRRWWLPGYALPEYDRSRGGDPYIEGDRSQRLHWRSEWVAGIYQVADVIPCTTYELSGWVNSHAGGADEPNARIGIDPTGTEMTSSPSSGQVNSLPPLTDWSAYGTQTFAWEEMTTQTEALGPQVTAIVYSAPKRTGTLDYWYSIYFDAISLTEVPWPDGKLPAPAFWTPTGIVHSVQTSFITPTLTVTWTTSVPASTQILYEVDAAIITPTASMTYTTYLPLIANHRAPYLDPTPRTTHVTSIRGLKTGDVVRFLALSRKPDVAACTTEVSLPYEIAIGDGALVPLDPNTVSPLLYAGN